MKFFLPDSQDLVDPTFDFAHERRAATRLRQRDDLYAHELFSTPAYDGLLVSKGMVDGFGTQGSRYTLAQRHRLLRLGAPEFFRLQHAPRRPQLMGDCGAFAYVREEAPPYSVQEVLEFYAGCRFDYGLSVDHVILEYVPGADEPGEARAVPEPVRRRQELTLELARDFLHQYRAGGYTFEPLGVAQGWSPRSYAHAVAELQRMGYRYVALGGMVPLKSREILQCLEAIGEVREPQTRLHLLGVTRTEHLEAFARQGVASFDSTSPLRQAFKDDRDNYYAEGAHYTAIRIPQVEGNPALQRRIAAGQVSQEQARRLERACLVAMEEHEAGRRKVEEVVEVLLEYERLWSAGARKDHGAAYRKTLEDAPWRRCPCEVCRQLGHHVILFRGAERNRRRGFHNVWTFYRQLQGLALGASGERRAGPVRPAARRSRARTQG